MEQMKQYSLGEAEYRFAEIIWANEPVNSGELVALSEKSLGWKKSTTYTVLKKLCDKGIFRSEGAVVSAIVGQEQVQKYESEQFLDGRFGGSLPRFLASFMDGKKISPKEADELKRLIDSHREK